MLAASTELKKAQKVKEFLAERNLINQDYLAAKELDHIYFPLLKKVKVPNAEVVNTKFEFQKKEKQADVEELLRSRNRIGKSYYESFINLGVFKIFSESELKELANTAGFRNRLAHEYLDVNEDLALKSMEKILVIYPQYIKMVQKIIGH